MKRGDVYLADLDPTKGSEQAGRRPVLIFQDDRLIQATLTVVVVPFTTNLKMQNLPTCVLVPAGEGGLRQDSVAIGHQIRALDKKGLLDCWGTCQRRAWPKSSAPCCARWAFVPRRDVPCSPPCRSRFKRDLL